MRNPGRRLALVLGTFIVTWLVASVFARWLFGSGNVLVWVLAAVLAAVTYLALLRYDQRLR